MCNLTVSFMHFIVVLIKHTVGKYFQKSVIKHTQRPQTQSPKKLNIQYV